MLPFSFATLFRPAKMLKLVFVSIGLSLLAVGNVSCQLTNCELVHASLEQNKLAGFILRDEKNWKSIVIRESKEEAGVWEVTEQVYPDGVIPPVMKHLGNLTAGQFLTIIDAACVSMEQKQLFKHSGIMVDADISNLYIEYQVEKGDRYICYQVDFSGEKDAEAFKQLSDMVYSICGKSDIAMRDRKIAMSEHNTAVEKAPENCMKLQRELWDLYCRCRLAPESDMSPLHQRLSAVAEPASLYMLAVFFAECMPKSPKLLAEDMELTDEELAQQDRVFALWSGRRSSVWSCKEALFRMASAGDASAREYLQRLVRDYPGDNAMDARYAELPDKASTLKAPRK